MAESVINRFSSAAQDPLRSFRFYVEFLSPSGGGSPDPKIANFSGGFTNVTGLGINTQSIAYREGGYNTTVHQIPGQTTFAPITLQRGVILNTNQNWEWMRNLFATVQAGGSTRSITQNFRCDLEISVLSHPLPKGGSEEGAAAATDHVAMRFHVYNAWPTSVAYSDLNAGDNALFVEQMSLVHEGFDVNWAADLSTQAASF